MRLAPIALVALASCATVAPHDEFASYRAARHAHDTAERVAGAQEYLRVFPHGTLRRDALRDLDREEPSFWRESRGTYAGLYRYLAAYPDGNHAPLARERLADILREVDEARTARRAEDMLRYYEGAQRGRGEAYRFARHWLVRLGSLREWNESVVRTVTADPSFEREFSAGPPRCASDGCFVRDENECLTGDRSHPWMRIDVSAGLRSRDGGGVAAEVRFGRGAFGVWRDCVANDRPSAEASRSWAFLQLQGLVASAFPGALAVTTPGLELDAGEKIWMRYEIGCPNSSGAPIPSSAPAFSLRGQPVAEEIAHPSTCLAIEIFAGPGVTDGGGIRITPAAR